MPNKTKSKSKLIKKNKHPQYFDKAKITCACGNNFEIGSTSENMNVEICSACHPLYTGKHKFIDAARRVDKFQERIKKAEDFKKLKKEKKKITK